MVCKGEVYMEGERIADSNKIQTGLRIPETRYKELKAFADQAGVSLNAVILMLVDIGLSVVNHGIQEEDRSQFHIPKYSGGQ